MLKNRSFVSRFMPMISRLPIFTGLCLALLAACGRQPADGKKDSASPQTTVALPEKVTFNAHIRPIFSDTCFSCHGFDAKTRKADLRLDTPDGAYAKLKDSEIHAIVPGKPDESAILKHIVSNDPEMVMPPPEFHKVLSERQKSLIRKWIEQGAKYEKHWSFIPISKSPLPKLAKHSDKAENPIDHFILARLESEGVEPAAIADKATLLRRLSLDLTGLPPSPQELDAFLADDGADAYTKQVERLLASPRYGERMAVWWLDVARYADTVGFHGDQTSRVFPYRDYVIKAFNGNMPFDRFTREQLAGDLLENPTDEQRIATGFLRLNMMTREGGAQPGEYMAKYMGDRIRALGGAWLGLTTGCAECHDHKFDPISSKDYYSLGAFFGDVRQWGLYTSYSNQPNPDLKGWSNNSPFPPEIHLRNPALEQRIEMLRGEMTELLATMKAPANDIAAWADQSAAFLKSNPHGWQTLPPAGANVAVGKYLSAIRDDGSVLITGTPDKEGKIVLRLPLPDAPVRSIRLEALPDETNGGFVGRATDGRFAVKTSFAIEGENGITTKLAIAWSQADKRQPHQYDTMGDKAPRLEDEWRSGPAHLEFPRDAARHPQHAVFHLAEPMPAAKGRVLLVTLETNDLGRARFSVTPFGGAIPGYANAHRDQLAAALATPVADRNDAYQREIAAAYFHGTRSESQLTEGYAALRDAILECRAGYAHSMIVETLPEDKRIPVHFLPRGDWMKPGEQMQPALPEFFAGKPAPDGRTLNRLDLVNWLMAPENPLTARHFMNRMWHMYFGRGLSGIVDDLGSQGEMPTHPELLDWLATEFRESGWDVKHMAKLIVTSSTYRREAAASEELLEKDPGNRLLAGQSARRLDAEFIRDNALAISGLLRDDIIGGPSAKPYQPEGYYENLNFPIRDYHVSTGDAQYRRGLYMHWQRTFLHPMLAAFDAPSREECTPSRFQANSPQQALVLLNDPTFVEAARAFAQRLMKEKPDNDDETRIRHAIQIALAREPRDGETESLLKFLNEQRANYGKNSEAASALLRTGQTGITLNGAPAGELAAWTQLCRVILNLHETITRY
jgi:mono/diheme cytochrome c family protein